MTTARSAPRAQALPAQAFFGAAPERAALARERFFEQGQRPTGLVSEPVIQSWQRCLGARRAPPEPLSFEPVTAARRHAALQRGRGLLQAADGVMPRLQQVLATTRARALLCDADGVVVRSTPRHSDGGPQPVLTLAAREGVDLSEQAVGTTAPGIVLHSGLPCNVTRGEHFFDLCGGLSCAAAPIRDRQGRVAGVLDLTVEGRPFGFDATALVGQYAAAIENALLEAPDGDCLVLRFQADPLLLGTPLQALAGVDGRGRVRWTNEVGRRLLGLPVAGGTAEPPLAEALFGVELGRWPARSDAGEPQPVHLGNGLVVWLQAVLQLQRRAPQAAGLAAQVEAAAAEPSAPPAPPVPAATLAEHDHRLVLETLQRCGGNVSLAARTLGVSRGLLYRRLAAMGRGV
jgi:sigma-54 dependent transcriptional regulator, acetoin dehydrogenase operon transcriptional activator AcoR